MEYYDFSTWPEGAALVKEMFSFLPEDDGVRTAFLETFAIILLTV